MNVGFILAAAMLAQATDAPDPATPAQMPPVAQTAPAYGPSAPAPPRPAGSAATARKDCSPKAPDPETGAIVVCVIKPNGYRLDPDVMAAKKAKRDADHGRPPPPERYVDNNCSVGPHACVDTGINLLAVALTAAQMAERLSKGQEIGSMFVTDPQMSEYQYYQLARKEREQTETEAANKAYAAQVDAEAAAAKVDSQDSLNKE
jgi:hypothetical protein